MFRLPLVPLQKGFQNEKNFLKYFITIRKTRHSEQPGACTAAEERRFNRWNVSAHVLSSVEIPGPRWASFGHEGEHTDWPSGQLLRLNQEGTSLCSQAGRGLSES